MPLCSRVASRDVRPDSLNPSARVRSRSALTLTDPHAEQFKQFKLVYRRYAGLYFTLCVESNDNELAMFESIHLLVEVLDQFFGNVCELDLVYNFYKVRQSFAPERTRRRARRSVYLFV